MFGQDALDLLVVRVWGGENGSKLGNCSGDHRLALGVLVEEDLLPPRVSLKLDVPSLERCVLLPDLCGAIVFCCDVVFCLHVQPFPAANVDLPLMEGGWTVLGFLQLRGEA